MQRGGALGIARELPLLLLRPARARRPAPAAGAERPEPDNQWYLFNDTRVSFSSFESASNVTLLLPHDSGLRALLPQRIRGGSRPSLAPALGRAHLHKDLMEAISKDNILFLQVSRPPRASSSPPFRLSGCSFLRVSSFFL